ncbi:MAG: glycosyltransferase family 9 protein [Bacteriovoracaceae bacterium]
MKILINRSDAIGDSLLTLPICRYLKEHFPNIEIIYVCSKRSQEVFSLIGDIDKVVLDDKSLSVVKRFCLLFQMLLKEKPDYYLYLGGGHLLSFISFLLRVPLRGGLQSKLSSFLFLNRGVRQSRSREPKHESEWNLETLVPFDLVKGEIQTIWNYPPTVHHDQFDSNFHFEVSKDQKLIVVHPGMTGHSLNWSSSNYAGFIKSLVLKLKEDSFKIVISYTPSDLRYVDPLKELLKDEDFYSSLVWFDGSVKGLKDYMHLLKKADLFIGPSTGTTHLASILDVKTIGFYSPIKAQSVERWGPLKMKDLRRNWVFSPPRSSLHGGNDSQCMDMIKIEPVVDKALEFLENEA